MHLELEKPKLVNPKLFAARMAQAFCIVGIIVILYFIVQISTQLFGPNDGSIMLLGLGLVAACIAIAVMEDHIRENNGWWPEAPESKSAAPQGSRVHVVTAGARSPRQLRRVK